MPGYNNGVHGPGGAGHDYGGYEPPDTRPSSGGTFSRVRGRFQQSVADLFSRNTQHTMNKMGRWQSHFGAPSRPSGFPSPYQPDQGAHYPTGSGQVYPAGGHAGPQRYGHVPPAPYNFSQGKADFRRTVFEIIKEGSQSGAEMLRGFAQEMRALDDRPPLPPRQPLAAQASALSPALQEELDEIKDHMARFAQECNGHLEDFKARLQHHERRAEALAGSGAVETEAGRAEMERQDHAIATLNDAIQEAEGYLQEGLVALNKKLEQAVPLTEQTAPPPLPPRKNVPDLTRVPPRKAVPTRAPEPPPLPPRSVSSDSQITDGPLDDQDEDDRFDDGASDRTTLDRPRVMKNPPPLPPRKQSEAISGEDGDAANTAQDLQTAAKQFSHFAESGRRQSESISRH